MHLSKIEISGFRNIEHADLALNPKFNYVYGPNGAGKTALLEAINVLSRGRSFRSASALPLIKGGIDQLTVFGHIATTHESLAGSLENDSHGRSPNLARVGISKNRQGHTQIRVDGESSKRTSDLARRLPSQVVLPDAAELVFGAPGIRRSFLDWGLFHVEHDYLELSRRYRRILQQRNAWLKAEEDTSQLAADPWFEQMMDCGVMLATRQARYLQQLTPHVEGVLRKLMPGLDLQLSYGWGGLESLELAAKKWSESFPRDVKLGSTNRGPHRADIQALSQGNVASDVLSRGQAKGVASALILGQAMLQRSINDQPCVLLIDDFGAELDAEHWARFLEVLQEIDCQVVATSTVSPGDGGVWMDTLNCDVFHVKQGKFNKIRSTS